MLDQVELGLGGVVAQHAVVVAGIALHCVLVLLQVLRKGVRRVAGREGGKEGGREGEREEEEEVIADGRSLARQRRLTVAQREDK